MNIMKLTAFLAAYGISSTMLAAASIQAITHDSATGKITVTYTLTAPAIVTVDVTTNCSGQAVSIGRKNVSRVVGDVNRLVSDTESAHTIHWHPFAEVGRAVLGANEARFVLRTWATNAPPNYMVIDTTNSQRIRYYEDVSELPGGIEDDAYRTDMLVMRRIYANGVAWNMSAGTGLHQVTLTNDYYIAVFEMTNQQCENLTGWEKGKDKYSKFKEADSLATRPVDWMRIPAWVANDQGMRYPYPTPNEDLAAMHSVKDFCFVGKMRTKTGLGIYLDLPSEAQWEYAARAGSTTALPDGTTLSVETGGEDLGLSRFARYKYNGGYVKGEGNSYSEPDYATASNVNGTARVGSYEPNNWGLYDMLGNVAEWCLDRTSTFTSDPVIDPHGAASGRMVVRGGNWTSEPNACRLYSRSNENHEIASTGLYPRYGIRMCLTLQGPFDAPTEDTELIADGVRCGGFDEAIRLLLEKFSTLPLGIQFSIR